jgi:lysophospholipase L1-like esterase
VSVLQVERLQDRCLPSSTAYVTTLYEDLVHRTPSAAEAAGWVRILDAGVSTRYVARSFASSYEYRSDQVTADYGRFLHRAPDAPALAGFTAALAADLAPEQLEAILTGSDEYFTLHGRSTGQWLQAAYQDLLGRVPDPSGAGGWTAALRAGASRDGVAVAIAVSPEAMMQTVDAAYVEALGRRADATGLSFLVEQLTGGSSSTSILADIASSPEAVGRAGGTDPHPPAAPLDPFATPALPIPGRGVSIWDTGNAQNEEWAAAGRAPLLFLGDSITAAYAFDSGATVWNQFLAPLGAANFAIPGLTTSEVLWQVQSGQVAAVSPGIVVLMIGTNNLAGGQSPAAVAEGIGRIVDWIKAVSPGSRILLLGVFPRGFSATDLLRSEVAQVNSLISLLVDGRRVVYRDIGGAFLNADGSISSAVLADGLHPTQYGYELWTAAMWPMLVQLLAGQ